MEYIKVEGIVLKKHILNDSDIILDIFTKEYGKLTAIYFGIKKSLKKEKISIDNLSYSEFILKSKKNLETGLMDNIVSESSVINNFSNIKKNIYKLFLCLYIVYVLNSVLVQNEIETKIYKRLLNTLNYIENLENDRINSKIKMDVLIAFYLIRLQDDLGIYSLEELISRVSTNKQNALKNSVKCVFKYIKKETSDTSCFNSKLTIETLQNHINDSFNVYLDYNKIIFLAGD